MVGSRRAGRIGVAGMVFLLMVAACGDDDALQPGPVTSFEDIAGTYERQGPGPQGFFQFFEDGTGHLSSNRDLVEDRPSHIYETRFEGTTVFTKDTKGHCDDDDPGAIYEIHLLENGNLRFVAIEDACAHRSSDLQAAWAPVP